MNIVLNFIGLRAGGGRADAMNLLKAIPANASEDTFLAITPANHGYENISASSNCHVRFEQVRPFNNIWRLYFDNVTLTKICKQFKADILFTMCNTGPLKIDVCKHIIML
ncbi:MAG: hypothetical protein ACE5H1_01610, partial [Thermodesulfobacteriota bacterium]